MKYLYLALSSIILAYIIVILFTYLYQRKLLYHPSENNYTGDEIQFDYKEVFIEVNKGIKLKSWFLEKDLKKDKTILYFHGNAGDLTNRVHKLNELNKLDVNILIISLLLISNPVICLNKPIGNFTFLFLNFSFLTTSNLLTVPPQIF